MPSSAVRASCKDSEPRWGLTVCSVGLCVLFGGFRQPCSKGSDLSSQHKTAPQADGMPFVENS